MPLINMFNVPMNRVLSVMKSFFKKSYLYFMRLCTQSWFELLWGPKQESDKGPAYPNSVG